MNQKIKEIFYGNEEKPHLPLSEGRKRSSKTHGTGLFANEAIQKGEIVAVKGGYVMSRSQWSELEPIVGYAAEIQISDDLVIAPSSPDEFEGCMMALNHSCEPNVGVDGQISYVAMRSISPGEELTIDYAMIDDHDEKMDCSCGKNDCRRMIGGKDWRKPHLQERYRGYFASFIQNKIDGA